MFLATSITPLCTVFPDQRALPEEVTSATVLRGSTLSLQIAIQVDKESTGRYRIIPNSPLPITIRQIRWIGVSNPSPETDEDYLRTTPGLYPDPLEPLGRMDSFHATANHPNMLWVTIPIPQDAPAGSHTITFAFERYISHQNSWERVEFTMAPYEVTVLPYLLPEQQLLRFEWFHCDCIASAYNDECWSERHWQHVEAYMANAASHGINVLYTPLWTPPLDTAIGHQRPDCQLLEVSYRPEKDNYTFDFSRLERYLDMGLRLGMKRFFMSHLFSQWGAKACPVVRINYPDGSRRECFGWETASDAPEYLAFLSALLPQLMAFLEQKQLSRKVFFAVSDEPQPNQLPEYSHAAKFVRPLLQGAPVLEALSSVEFLQHGLVDIPVPVTNHFHYFDGKTTRRWTYYCCCPQNYGPNRFIAMPRRRIRALGLLAYCHDLEGFLHWGYNFYYSQLSWEKLDPFASPDADGAFPAGDAFLVYPGRDGRPWDSVRNEILGEAMEDLRLLRLLESKIGREAVLDIIGRDITFQNYPKDDQHFLQIFQRVLQALQA